MTLEKYWPRYLMCNVGGERRNCASDLPCAEVVCLWTYFHSSQTKVRSGGCGQPLWNFIPTPDSCVYIGPSYCLLGKCRKVEGSVSITGPALRGHSGVLAHSLAVFVSMHYFYMIEIRLNILNFK